MKSVNVTTLDGVTIKIVYGHDMTVLQLKQEIESASK